MISTGDLKKGLTIELDGQIYTILDYQHIKMGRGSATIRLKLRDIRAGHIIERTFQAGEKFGKARLDRHTVQFLYEDGGLYYFMDSETFEQNPLNADLLGDALGFLKEGLELDFLTYLDEPIGIELPTTVELEVTETDPGLKGDTASGGSKPSRVETGISVQVPLFINIGDVIRVDTRTSQYVERVS